MRNYLLKIIFLLWPVFAFGNVQIKYFNERFVWIEVPSSFVKARLNYPVEGYSVCWIEVHTKEATFDFVMRRGLAFDTCMTYVLQIRKLLKKNPTVQIIGNAGSKEKQGHYYSMWELIRGKTGCVGYFGGCDNFEKENVDWNLWKDKPINSKLYP